MRLSGCPEFGQGRDPKFYVTRTVFLTRLGSPEGGRPIFPGPWPENRALPGRAAGLVPDALAKAQAPSGVLSVPGARSEWLSDFMSDFVPDLVSDFVSGLGPATLGMWGPILDPIFSCCAARRSGRKKIGREIGRKIGRRIGPHLGHPKTLL